MLITDIANVGHQLYALPIHPFDLQKSDPKKCNINPGVHHTTVDTHSHKLHK